MSQIKKTCSEYSKYIELTMTIINYLFSADEFIIETKDDDKTFKISLNENGFVLKKQIVTETGTYFEEKGFQIDPVYILSILFKNDNNNEYEIDRLLSIMPIDYLDSAISFTELVHLIEIIDKDKENNIDDFNCMQAREMLNRIGLLDYSDFDGSTSLIDSLDKALLRKIERMCRLESYLQRYSRYDIVEKSEKEIEWGSFNNCEQVIDSIDLTNKEIEWNEFCELISSCLEEDVFNRNIEWKMGNADYSRGKNILGLDPIVAPGSITVYEKRAS